MIWFDCGWEKENVENNKYVKQYPKKRKKAKKMCFIQIMLYLICLL